MKQLTEQAILAVAKARTKTRAVIRDTQASGVKVFATIARA